MALDLDVSPLKKAVSHHTFSDPTLSSVVCGTITMWIRLGEVNENDLRSELYKDILASLRAAGIPVAAGGLDAAWFATAATQNQAGESTA